MMKKTVLSVFLFMISIVLSVAQSSPYYWHNGKKNYLEIVQQKRYVVVKDVDTLTFRNNIFTKSWECDCFRNMHIGVSNHNDTLYSNLCWTIAESENNIFPNTNDIFYEAPFFKTLWNDTIGLSHLFYVKLKAEEDYSKLVNLSNIYNVTIIGNNEYMPLWYTLSCSNKSTGNALEMSNVFYESNLFATSEPDFMIYNILNCVNDTYYSNQWGLNNTGQNGGTSGIDINFCKAKSITTGNQNIIVAVLDQGVELNHPDLTNMSTISYDTETSSSPSQVYGEHGTACAGIIGADANNNIGIAGIAPNSPIMSISNSLLLNVDTKQKLANGINYAWQNGASVISNSWGHYSLSGNYINNAIDNAVTNGRNGKGCVIVFASGNDNLDSVSYPASLPQVIAVGAISPCGERKSPTSCDTETTWGSHYGQALSVVAPGVLIPTTDRQGNAGYNPNLPIHTLNHGTLISQDFPNTDYTIWFNGTSSACPHVSGVAALILSVNPSLTEQQVRDIIETTAQRIRTDLYTYTDVPSDHPNGPWNNQMGYGLVDAHAAVMEAYFYDRQILGSNTISPCSIIYPCNGIITYNLNSSSMPSNTTLQWSVSGNLALVSSNNQSISVLPTGIGSGTITISYTHEGYTVTRQKEITIESFPPSSNYYCNYSTTGNMTFSNELYINGTFTINSGHVVTISCIGHCLPDAKIVIQPGGKLIVDGGTLTNLCPNKMWDAIYVVGNYYQRQLAQYQGTIEVKNNSVIENSKWGIVTWNGTDYATSGGIVKCSSSTFRNNGKAIEFYPYTNHNSSGAETDNVNYAQKCTFVVDGNNLFASNNITFSEFVKISHVRGISFKGSSFRDGRTTASSQTKGIYSESSGFSTSEHCTLPYSNLAPCTCTGTETRTKFSRLGYGIYATNDGTTYNFTADHAIFDTCYNAVYMSAINNSKITRSNFDINTMSTFANGSATGIYSYNCSGYTIEANDFSTYYTIRPSGFFSSGIRVLGSGTDDNTIYRNNITNLYYGIKSEGSNSGLQLQCNEFSGTFGADINVSGALSGSQGSSSKSAGNKFTSGVKKINSPSTYITYYHSGANNSSNVYCPNNSSATIVRVPNITANDCASTICIPFPAYPPTPKSAPENDDITLYESLKQIYESHLTEYTAAGYDFLLENFDENDADIVAIARLKQDTLISLSRTMAEIAKRNLNAILADSVLDRESLNGWYNRISTQTAKYSLVNSYFEIGEYALARQELAAIPQHFALSADELAEYDNFCDYNALRESVFTSGRNYAQLTEEEIAELEAIADLNTGVSSAYANSVLCFFYGICQEIEEQDFDDTPMNNKNAVANVEENETESLAVYVYPNPADDELNILISSLPEGITTIEFHDVAGRLILSQEIASTNASINISPLKQGVYMYRIVNGDNVIARDRIVKK